MGTVCTPSPSSPQAAAMLTPLRLGLQLLPHLGGPWLLCEGRVGGFGGVEGGLSLQLSPLAQWVLDLAAY